MANKKDIYLYFVEGETEYKIVEALKNKYLISGKIRTHNVVTKKIQSGHLSTIKRGTTVIFIFDADIDDNITILEKNIDFLSQSTVVKNLILIPQINNLEDEIIYATKIKNIEELLDSDSTREFKGDMLKCTNTLNKLEEKLFDIEKFWSRNPTNKFEAYKNNSSQIKIIPSKKNTIPKK